MRTRNAETPKSGPNKKTPPAKKPAGKTPPKPPEAAPGTPSTTIEETKPQSAPGAKQTKNNVTASPATPKTASTPEPKVEEVPTIQRKTVSATKTVGKKIPGKSKTSSAAKAVSSQTPKSDSAKNEDMGLEKVGESANKEDSSVANVQVSLKEEVPVAGKVEEPPKEEDPIAAKHEESSEKEEPIVAKVEESVEEEKANNVKEEGDKNENQDEESKAFEEDTKDSASNPANMEEDIKDDLEGKNAETEEDEHGGDEIMGDNEQERFEVPGDEECDEDDASEPDEEAGGLEDEHREITAVAKERKLKKEKEIFVGGLDRDATEDDVKKAFERIGDIVEVRLNKNPLTNKNKGYAFVKFSDKEQATRALSELKNPLIRGKRCGTAPSEDNDTLFLGNICNTWTKEAIKNKLKEYGTEGVENITLVPDAQHEGLSRGFAFLEFPCHADAMLAYKRLQKPDVIFGHAERTAKVAFAEPLREPDPEVMAQVKSVFVDGLPPHWDEDRVKEHFKCYGEIERIVLARNMSTAKRKDFGFVDFNTHEAAVACIGSVNNTEMGDEKSKAKVRARLSNPLPKTQAVKGGMRGGFRIGRAGGGSFSRFGRGFARGGRPFNRPGFQRGRGFYPRGRGQMGRSAFAFEDNFESPYSAHGRHPFGMRGGRRGSFRGGAYQASGGAATSSRSNLDRSRHMFRRQPFIPEGDFGGPFIGRNFDEPYPYDETGHGIKRPFSMMDHEPGYFEPSRLRPRFDHPDPALSSRGTRYRDSFGTGTGLYTHDYYGSDYGGGGYSSLYGSDHSFGGGYYY